MVTPLLLTSDPEWCDAMVHLFVTDSVCNVLSNSNSTSVLLCLVYDVSDQKDKYDA